MSAENPSGIVPLRTIEILASDMMHWPVIFWKLVWHIAGGLDLSICLYLVQSMITSILVPAG